MNSTTLKEILRNWSQPSDVVDGLIHAAHWSLVIIIAINAAWVWLARRKSTRIAARIALWISLFGFLFLVRFPVLVAGEINPDEGEELAEALTFLHDLRPWGSADGHTHGFPVPVSLLVLKLLGLPLDYFGARLVAIATILLVAAAVGAVVRRSLDERAALLASSVVTLCMASISEWDVLAFNGEYICVLVATAALLCMLWSGTREGNARRYAVAGAAFFTVLLPFVKLQVAPLAVVFGYMAVVIVARSVPRTELPKELGILVGAGALALLALLGFIAVGGGFSHFIECYILDALVYVKISSWEPGKFTTFVNKSVSTLGVAPWWALVLAGAICTISHRKADAARISRPVWSSVFVTAAVLVYCVYRPSREFPHYLNLILFASAALIALIAAQAVALSTRPALTSTIVLAVFFWTPDHVVRQGPKSLDVPTYDGTDLQAGAVIAQFSTPAEPVAVWGWMGRYFVLSQRGSASRHTIVTDREVNRTRNAETFRPEYLRDLTAKNPPVFVDAVGPGSFAYQDRATSGHESFPELAQFVARSYDFVQEVGRARIYVRRDRLAAYDALSAGKKGQDFACLGEPANQALVSLVRCRSTSAPRKLQLQRVGGAYQLRSAATDLCVQVSDKREDAWTFVTWETCKSDEQRQLWTLLPERDGRNVVSNATAECLGANHSNGSVRLRRCRGVAAEIWPEPQSPGRSVASSALQRR